MSLTLKQRIRQRHCPESHPGRGAEWPRWPGALPLPCTSLRGPCSPDARVHGHGPVTQERQTALSHPSTDRRGSAELRQGIPSVADTPRAPPHSRAPRNTAGLEPGPSQGLRLPRSPRQLLSSGVTASSRRDASQRTLTLMHTHVHTHGTGYSTAPPRAALTGARGDTGQVPSALAPRASRDTPCNELRLRVADASPSR